MKRITFTRAESLAAEKGAKLTREGEVHFHGHGIITDSWYQLDILPAKKFNFLTQLWEFLINLPDYDRSVSIDAVDY